MTALKNGAQGFCAKKGRRAPLAFVFITGGVLSSVGKGMVVASLGALLKARGLRVVLRKLDPYLNVNPGLMSPSQHGEVYVTADGEETDLDLGHYERFAGVKTSALDYVTTGKIYQQILRDERSGAFDGATVQVVPHVTNAIKRFLQAETEAQDVVIAEIGGTVGDIEGLPFLEAIRQLRYESNVSVCCVHVGWVPYVKSAGESKTKPFQHSVKELQRAGIHPDLLMVRSEQKLEECVLQKISNFCGVPFEHVVSAEDQSDLYRLPLAYHEAGLDKAVLRVLNHLPATESTAESLEVWKRLSDFKNQKKPQVCVGIVGKYSHLPDAYKSLIEAIKHAAFAESVDVKIAWVNPEEVTEKNVATYSHLDGIIAPGGFGLRGANGTMCMSRFAQEKGIPFLGICLGMQLAVIAIMQKLEGFKTAHSLEFKKTDKPLVVPFVSTKASSGHAFKSVMRLGEQEVCLKKGSLAAQLYKQNRVLERHRHRYMFNMDFKKEALSLGFVFSGMSSCGNIAEVIELKNHPFFVGVQFHPEFQSIPLKARPLFCGFIRHTLALKKKTS